MSDYLTAYRARLERNHQEFLRMAEELKKLGCRVLTFAKPEALISSIRVERDGKACHFGFAETPYRWYVGVSWKPNHNTGSGRYALTMHGEENQITPAMIIEQLYPGWEGDTRLVNYREL